MAAKKKTKKIKQSKSLAKIFEIDIQPFDGIITSQEPYTIGDNNAVWLEGLPLLTGSIETPPACSTLYTHSSTINQLITFGLGQNQYFATLDGSNFTFWSSSFTQISSFSTSRTVCDYAIQNNQYIWVVTRDFLKTFNGSTVYDLTGRNVLGDAICYWKGRIFIAKDNVITFSVPNPDATNATNPFDTASGAGSITLTIGEFSKILALIPKEDSIYIFTDRNVVALLGTTISNDPTQWYLTEILKEFGIAGIRQYCLLEHYIYFATSSGIYRMIATSPEKIDVPISNLTNNVYAMGICYYKQIPYFICSLPKAIDTSTTALYCFNTVTDKWYALNVPSQSITIFKDKTYLAQGTKVLQLFGDTSNYLPLNIKSKVFFNPDNVYFNIKDIIVYGRGNYDYVGQYISLVFAGTQDKIIFTTQSGSLMVFTQSGDFWVAKFKPQTTQPYQMRVKEFQLVLQQSMTQYSEIINIRIKGTYGARYL